MSEMFGAVANRSGKIRAVFALALAVCLAPLSGEALAQSVPPAPVRENIDPNGVDLFTGKLTVTGPVLTLGSEGNALSYYRWNKGSGWADNVSAYLNLSGSVMTVSLGGESDSFTVSGSTYTSTEANGSTLTFNSSNNIFTYTRSDGTVATFLKTRTNTEFFTYSNSGMASEIVRPNGEKLVYSYDSLDFCAETKSTDPSICVRMATAYRLASVISSYGYKLAASYDPYEYWYDDMAPWVYPNLALWTQIIGFSGSNLASPSSGVLATQSFAVSSPGGVTTYTITDAASRETKFRQGSGGEVAGITLPGDTSEFRTINYSGGAVSSIVQAGGTTTYGRSDSGNTRTVTVTDPVSNAVVYTFDIALRRLKTITVTESPGVTRTTAFDYDSSGRLTRTTYPETNYVQLTRDARGNVTESRAVSKTAGTPADIVTIAGYDATCSNPRTCNQPNWTKDANNNQTDYTYDSTHGGVLTVTSPADAGGVRPQVRYNYTSLQAYYANTAGSIVASGQPVYRLTSVSRCQNSASCINTSTEARQTIGYGPQTAGTGNNLLPVSVTQAAGDGSLSSTTSFEYDVIGNLVAVDGPQSGTADRVLNSYDALRRLAWRIGPDPDGAGAAKFPAMIPIYRADGQVDYVQYGTVDAQNSSFSTWNRTNVRTYAYDSAHRPIREALFDGAATTAYQVVDTVYDAASRAQCAMQRMDPSNWGTQPGSCAPTQTTGPNGPDRVTYNHYDALGRVWKVTTGYGTSSAADEQISTFSANGQRATLTDAEGNRTSYEYDGHDRLLRTWFPSLNKGSGTSSGSDYEQVSYDANGNVTSFRTRLGETLGLTYDNLNRLVTKVVPERSGLSSTHTRDVFFGYDLFGNMTHARFDSASGEGVTNTFDALGQLTSTTTDMDSTTRTLSYLYDAAGNRTRLTWPDGNYINYYRTGAGAFYYADLNGSSPLFYTPYDAVGRVAALYRWDTSAATWNQATMYSYDAVSRLSAYSHAFNNSSYDTTTAFGYNPASQIISRANSNDTFAFTAHVNVNRGYTPNGLNQYTAVASTSFSYDANGNLISDGADAFTYDPENRMVSHTQGGWTDALRYDPLGRLYEQARSGSMTFGARFLWDGSDLISSYNISTGNVNNRTVHGVSPGDDPILYLGGSLADTTRRYMFADERGSIIARTANGTGTTVSVAGYDEYGIPTAEIAPFGYTGQMVVSGMYYYKARMYSPTLGRFMQTDPIGYGDSMNMYAYVRNDPVNGVDPAGLFERCKPSDPNCITVRPPAPLTPEEACAQTPGCANFDPADFQRAHDSGVNGTPTPVSDGSAPELVPQSGRPLDACQVRIATQVLSSHGMPTDHLSGVRFRSSIDGDANWFSRTAFKTNVAVTQGSIVYIHPNTTSLTRFEEISHTSQFAKYGTVGFYAMYAGASAVGAQSPGPVDVYANNLLEVQAKGFAAEMDRIYSGGKGC